MKKDNRIAEERAAAHRRILAWDASMVCVPFPSKDSHLSALLKHQEAAALHERLDPNHPLLDEHRSQAAYHIREMLRHQ